MLPRAQQGTGGHRLAICSGHGLGVWSTKAMSAPFKRQWAVALSGGLEAPRESEAPDDYTVAAFEQFGCTALAVTTYSSLLSQKNCKVLSPECQQIL